MFRLVAGLELKAGPELRLELELDLGLGLGMGWDWLHELELRAVGGDVRPVIGQRKVV